MEVRHEARTSSGKQHDRQHPGIFAWGVSVRLAVGSGLHHGWDCVVECLDNRGGSDRYSTRSSFTAASVEGVDHSPLGRVGGRFTLDFGFSDLMCFPCALIAELMPSQFQTDEAAGAIGRLRSSPKHIGC